jgi:predicted amidophosphoribosyltransferase
MRDAFAVTCTARDLSGTTVVLIDDVSTAGASLDACARMLKRQGSLRFAP